MLELILFGSPNLVGPGGGELLSVLSQPKRLALLAYLAAAAPVGRHRRDELVGIFWPDLEEKRARNSLSQAMHRLSRSLGEGVLQGKGSEDVGLNPDAVWCDVRAFEMALDAGDPEAAVGFYRGELLKGFYLSDAPAFERWLDSKRAEVDLKALDTLGRLAERDAEAGRFAESIDWARKAVLMAPNDEGAVQRLIRLLYQTGDRAGAVRTYQSFADGIQAELGVEPADETKALIAELLRANGGGSAPAADDRTLGGSVGGPATDAGSPGPAPKPVSRPTTPARRSQDFEPGAGRPEGRAQAATRAIRSMAVLPFAQMGPDRDRQYPTEGLHDQVISELNLIPRLTVISRTSVAMYEELRRSIPAIAHELEVEAVMEGSVFREGDRVQVNVHLFRAIPEEQLWSRTFVRRVQSVISFNSEIARVIALDVQAALALNDER